MNQFKELYEGLDKDLNEYYDGYDADTKYQEDWKNQFFKDWDRLAKTKKLAGYDFTATVKDAEKFNGNYARIEIKTNQPHKGGTVGFTIEFLDNTRGQKIAKTIQISSDAKRGVIEKKVSGRNATADKIWAKLDKFFTYGKWV